MALSGNLGFVPLDEVLRLLTRSDQRGAVEVRGEDIRGRIFVGRKGVSLATTAEDRDLHKHLVNSGYVDDAFLRKIVSGESSFTDLGDRESSIIDLLREITIESIYNLRQMGATFEVAEGATSAYGSPRGFELEAILDDARRRADEWSTVHQTIADLDATIQMNRDPGDLDEIKIDLEAWRLLCEIGSGASIKVMAERLGTTEFWIARVAADMAEQELLVLAEEWEEIPETPASQYAPAEDEESNPNESWWVEPEDEEPVAEVFEESAAEESAQPAKDSRFGHFLTSKPEETFAPSPESVEAPAAAREDYEDTGYGDVPSLEPTDEAEDVEEDTEAFLEKVFSQLEVNGQVDVEEEGHGLLRRRRMGSVLKEVDED